MANDRLQFLFESIVGGRYVRRELYQSEIYKTLLGPSSDKDDKAQALVDMVTPVDCNKILTCLGEDVSFLDTLVETYAGSQGVLQTLETAYNEKIQRDDLLEQIRTMRFDVATARFSVQDHASSLKTLNEAVRDVKRDLFYIFKNDKREAVRRDQEKIRSSEVILRAGSEDLRGREENLAALSNRYREITANEDFQYHQGLLNAFTVVASDIQGQEILPVIKDVNLDHMAEHLAERIALLTEAQKMAGMTKMNQAIR